MSTTATPEAQAAPKAAAPTPPQPSAAPQDQAPKALSAAAAKFRDRMLSGALFRLFLWLKLPLAGFAGLRVKSIETSHCEVTLPAGWRTQNPFGSIYFAAHAMAAEMSSGALVLLQVAQVGEGTISTLVGRITADYKKAAKSLVTYRCEDGAKVAAAVALAAETGEALECETRTRGTTADGTVVAEFTIMWSMKRRSGAKK